MDGKFGTAFGVRSPALGFVLWIQNGVDCLTVCCNQDSRMVVGASGFWYLLSLEKKRRLGPERYHDQIHGQTADVDVLPL
jgi:hypothetical protein